MNDNAPARQILPLPLPENRMQRVVLIALRRMAGHGIRDAQATMLFINTFGPGFRQPLVLMRAFVAEMAGAAMRRITMAPCCALRMTMDEALMVEALSTAGADLCGAETHLRDVAGGADVSVPLSTAAAFAEALANLGRPLAG